MQLAPSHAPDQASISGGTVELDLTAFVRGNRPVMRTAGCGDRPSDTWDPGELIDDCLSKIRLADLVCAVRIRLQSLHVFSFQGSLCVKCHG